MDNIKVATKADVKDLKVDTKFLRQEILKVEERVENLEEGQHRLEKKIDGVEHRLEKKIDGVEQVLGEKMDKIMNTLVGFVGTVDDLRVDDEVGTHHTREIRIQVDDHEKRIVSLESSVKV